MTKKEISAIIGDIAVMQVYALLTAHVPFFALPIIGGITKIIIKKILLIGIDFTVLNLGFAYIDLTRYVANQEFMNAMEKFKTAFNEGTYEQIQEASRNFDKAFDAATHMRRA